MTDGREIVAPIATRRSYPTGATIVAQGERADTYYVIVAGKVAARVTTRHGDELTLSVMGAGDGFGEVALVGKGGRRTASVVALEPTDVLVVTRAAFDRRRREDPALERFLTGVLAQRVERLTAQLQAALYLTLEERVAAVLVRLAAVYRVDDATPPAIALSQADIASIVGISRQRCNRVLRDLATSGAIQLRRNEVVVLAPITPGVRPQA
jgi:CRP-like cAMP-binding protein